VVHSRIELAHLGEGGKAEFKLVTMPSILNNIDPSSGVCTVQMSQPLGGPVPYRGGPLALELGLFSVKSKDLAGPFIELLQDLSKQAGVSYVTQAMPFVGPIKRGLELLVGSGQDVQAHVGVDRKDDPPATGWYVVIAADKAKDRWSLTNVRIDPSDFRLLDRSGQPIQAVPYFVFVIKASTRRDEWHQIPELRQLYAQLRDAIRRNNIDETKHQLATLRRYLLTSPDLLPVDANRIFTLVEREAKAVFPTAMTTAERQAIDIPELATLPLYAPA
jgi:hypothetical protein